VDSSSFIGLVNPSQVSSFNLAFQIDDTARAGTYTVIIKATYRNGFGESFTVTRNIQYRVEESPLQENNAVHVPPSNTPTLPTLLLAVVAVVSVLAGFLVGRAVRRR
jgi:hypothetical protein